jgi:hypothetical protein
MGPSVPVSLDNRDYFLRFGYRNSRLAVSAMQAAMPQRTEKLTIGDFATLVMRQDQDAVLVGLYRGLNHQERETVKLEQVERWLENAFDAGRDMSEFSIPILEALEQAHLVSINWKPTVKEEEAKPEVGAFIDPLRRASGPLAAVGHDETSRD